MYSYDQFSNLVSAKESGFETIFRSTDIVGNLYETKDCSDRIYGEICMKQKIAVIVFTERAAA